MFCDQVIQALPEVERICRAKYGTFYTEDLISEVKVAALEYGKWEERGNRIESWMIEIAKNKYKSELAYRKRNPYTENESLECSYQPCEYDERICLQMIETLHEHLKHPLKMTMEGYKVREISKIMNLKQTTVKSKLWLARNTLKKKLIKAQAEI